MAKHTCHASNCTAPVPPSLLMCPKHWRMVPNEIQQLVTRYYVKGQERGGVKIRKGWFASVRAAIGYVATMEFGRTARGEDDD